MTFSAEIARRSLKLAPLVSIVVGSDTLRFSRAGLPAATSDGHFSDRITSLGAVTRELSDPLRGISEQGFSLALDNADASLSAHDPEDWLNAAVVFQTYAGGQAQTFFSGIVNSFSFGHKSLSLQVTDQGAETLGDTAKWYTALKPADWPGLDPASIDTPMPLVLGHHDSVAAGYTGAVPCVKLSPTRYLVAGHACASVYRVFESGARLTSGYSVNLALEHAGGVGGYLTVIDFDQAPSGAITCDVKGMTDDLTADGTLVTNLASQAELLRSRVFGLADEHTDLARARAAEKFCQKHRIRGAARLAEAKAPREPLGQLLGSGGLRGGWTAAGQWGLWFLDLPLGESSATPLDALRDLAPDGLGFSPDTEGLANHLTVQFLERSGGYLGRWTMQDADSQADLGRTYKRVFSLPCSADASAAWAVGQMHLQLSAYQYNAELSSPLNLAGLELGELLALADPWGPDAGGEGWGGRCLWPISLTFDPANGRVSARCLDASRLVE